MLLSDTVGFIKNLPHQLVASFKATLEEAVNADLLLHVIDISNTEVIKQIESVDKVLAEIGCGEKPVLEVFNKVDVIKKNNELEMLQTLYPDSQSISAKTGLGFELLRNAVLEKYKGGEILLRVTASQANGKIQSFLRAYGEVVQEQYSDSSVLIDARLGQNQLSELKRLGAQKLEIIN